MFNQQYFTDILRRPAIRHVIKNAYVSLGIVVTINDTRSEEAASPSEGPMSPSETTPLSQQLQDATVPFRAALYEQSAKGLGDWRIWLSGRAQEDLRKRKKADANDFGIIMKRLR